MSHDRELERIFDKDLTLSKNYMQSAYQDDLGRLQAENERLANENQALWQSVNAYRENTSLRAASVISYILSWSERKNVSNTPDFQVGKNEDSTADTRKAPTSPFKPILTPPEVNVQAPSRNLSYMDQVNSFQQISRHCPSKFSEAVDVHPSYYNPQQPTASAMILNQMIPSRSKSPVPPSTDVLKSQIPVSLNPSIGMQSIGSIGRSPSPSVALGRGNKPMKPSQLPFSNESYASDGNDWDRMVRKSPLPEGMQNNTPTQKLVSNQTITDRKSGKSGITLPNNPENNKTGSEGYGSQLAQDTMAAQTTNQSIGKQLVGEPIASSTPKASRGVLATSKQGSSIINRPIDQAIGFIPVLSETRRQKLAQINPSKRLIGEIAFQLDRRILSYVFEEGEKEDSKRKRYYGYNISNIGELIRREAVDAKGQHNVNKELKLRYRFEYLMKTLTKYGYSLEKHPVFSQDMVNKYGLLKDKPDEKMVKAFGLDDPLILRIHIGQLITDYNELEDQLILLDCLCVLAYDDKNFFSW